MTKPIPNPLLHPDDVLLFKEVAAAMRVVARAYDLLLRSVDPYPTPEYTTSPLGDCSATGHVRLVLRGMTNGTWDDEPRREQDVWNTAAHELAHLKHFNHGLAFQEFEEEMRLALTNRKQDHREKVLERLVKLQKSREGEAELGNTAAAEAFASMINKMLLEYELNPSDIDYARASDKDPVIEIEVDLDKYKIKKSKTRIAWQESLAKVVAQAHLCSFLIVPGTNRIYFVGTKSHATVAEYAFGTLVPATNIMSRREYVNYEYRCRHDGEKEKSHGFREAWLSAFIERIRERFEEARAVVVQNLEPETSSTALMRLDGAMMKTRKYIDDKFGKKRRYASQLNGGSSSHEDGRAAGRAAADRMVIGRRGIHQRTTAVAALGDGGE